MTYSGRNQGDILMYDRETQFNDFLKHSDIIFLAAPLTSDTKIINGDAFARMKDSCILINISRAELIDVTEFHKALSQKLISGAALDVHWSDLSEKEQQLADEIYMMPNVVLSPHRGGFSAGQLPHLQGAVENLRKVAQGRLDEVSENKFCKGLLMIKSERIILRMLEERDLESRVKWFNDHEINQFFGVRLPNGSC